ncbi:MAG: response regulator [Amphritea sp.]
MESLSLADLNIFLVEPSEMQRKLIVNELKREGIETIDSCGCKEDAVTMIRTLRPDLVISSMYFEDGTGLDLLRLIRNDAELDELPFMLISSETKRHALEEFKQSGVVAILPKPFTRAHLGQAIKATLDLLSQQTLELEYYDLESLRVLVVDDSSMARKVIIRVLTNLGIVNVTQAIDGSDAIKLLQDATFDLIVTDYNMPEVNGLELTEHVRQSPNHSHVPVLMVTSEASDAHLENVAQAGVNAILDKPFQPENIQRLLTSMLG